MWEKEELMKEAEEEEEEVGVTQSRGRRTRDVLQVESSRMD